MLVDELIQVEITSKKAKILSGNEGVDDYFLKQMLPWFPKVEDFSVGDEGMLAFVSLDREFGFFFYSSLINSLSMGENDRTLTRIIPVAPAMLLRYNLNPALMAYYYYSSGLFSGIVSIDELLPERSLFEPQRWAAEYRLVELAEIARAVEVHGRGVLIRDDEPLKYLASVYSQVPSDRRWETSFAIGSKISNSRPFHFHIRSDLDRTTLEFVTDNQIRYFGLTNSTSSAVV